VIEIVTNPPGSDASGKEVIAFYSAQGGTQQLGAALLALAFVFFLFFAGHCADTCARHPVLRR
jgi:hypothetical protein